MKTRRNRIIKGLECFRCGNYFNVDPLQQLCEICIEEIEEEEEEESRSRSYQDRLSTTITY